MRLFVFTMKYLLTFLGRALAASPEFAVRGLCWLVGTLIWGFPSGRNRVALSNISHCFPDMDSAQIDKIARQSARRMVEMALFVLASPYMSDSRLKSRIKISPIVWEELDKIMRNPRALVLMIPHFCMMETITMFPLLVGGKFPRTGVFYRPFDSPSMEEWIRKSRERFGINLLSRKKGLSSALDYLNNRGVVAILFDQNAGGSGVKTLFFERICSSSELAGLFVERTGCDCAIFYARRTGFWSSYIDGEFLPYRDREEVTIAANAWLENRIRSDETARFDWLWLHRRWYVNRNPRECLNIAGGRSILKKTLEFLGLKEMPRRDRIFIVAPAERSGAEELAAEIPALRRSRPDAEVTLLCEGAYARDFAERKVADCVLEIPARTGFGISRLKFFAAIRPRYPDILISFQSGFAADLEARITGAPMRLGVSSIGGARRRFFSCAYADGGKAGESTLANRALKYFGMRES